MHANGLLRLATMFGARKTILFLFFVALEAYQVSGSGRVAGVGRNSTTMTIDRFRQ